MPATPVLPTTSAAAPAGWQAVRQHLEGFKRKFYLSLLVRGALVAGGLLLTLFVVFNLLEYFLYLPTWVRGGLLFGFLGLTVWAFVHWIWQPLAALTNLRRLLSDEQAAQRVGQLFPEVQDKLLNALQLQGQARDNALIAASLEQRAGQLSGLEFAERIRIKEETRPLWKYAAVPAGVAAVLLLVWPALFVQGTERIFHYSRAYKRPMPFRFVVENKQLKTFKNEDFKLEVRIEGDAMPDAVNLLIDGHERRLTKVAPGRFAYTFQQPQRNVAFQLGAAGFTSDDYELRVLERPNLRDFAVRAEYPAYLRRATETLPNDGNLTVPEGTRLTWQFNTAATDAVQLQFLDPAETVAATAADDEQFTLTRPALRSQTYRVQLRNAATGPNRDPIEYQLTVVPDQAPSITVEAFADTATQRYLALAGTLQDDYGLTRLALHYRTGTARQPGTWRTAPLRLTGSGPNQTYTHQWDLAPLHLQPGQQLEYAVEVWDNDGLHGAKSTRTRPLMYRLPSRAELREQLNATSNSMQSQLSSAQKQSEKMQRELAKAQDKLKTKRELSFSDRKELKDLLDQKLQMDAQLQDMKQMFEQLQQKQNQLDPRSEQLAEKAQELQKLMDSLLDEKTKKLYEELQKMLEQQKAPNMDMQKLLDQLENKEQTLQKELERALDMFKQLQLEQKMESATEQLEKLAEQEQKLAEKTEKAADKPNDQRKQENEQLKQQQQEAQKAFEEVKKELKEAQKLDQDLDHQNNLDPMQQEQQQVDQQMQDSQEQLSKNQNQKASQNQKDAAKNMKEMAQKMRQQMEEGESDQQQQNIDDLRDILENLLKLSFDQESLMKDFRQVDQSDPRFVQLSQTQRKLRDDAVVIQDSLYALAKKVFQLQSFVTREVGEMNGQMDQAMEQLRQRNVGRATGNQQLAMTSMNNLALMLNDALKQMQEQMRQGQQAKSSGSGKPGKKKKGQNPGSSPGQMGKLQEQLNQQIQQLQQSGKSGRQLSEELAKMAAQQQMLRQALQELEKMQQAGKEGKNGKKDGKGDQGMGGLGDLKKMMEQTETDLVNKRLTEQTVMRQRQILSRLLEAEKSARERDLDNKREAETARTVPPGFPPAFEKYKQERQRQTELLRTVPPALTPYYQREVSEYFQKMK
ncbi:DUF4175 family protein [Hymenobacter busanensis]|uniref:DUF4175 family protein n=1 Tax=Hymenobacter busanensis TaxID=2607656 RepID=A0A7L5A1R6_9BACT|nr:DUF4175 family protein [Hymenobacter busanensis]KAA9332964.1 DUF4175 family protein [Hymenobacter busanensis]QHJ08362.1 DUF4175 family protein [Hymenobacter busanensis]